ncbi:crAss001_48 related protein [Bathymodiolus japonicus methanotrophic gill symbiont]|uniref:crAss001_48 related protein n=1 Tax=Bathymodiolus japonicus methanotrophic gill symbiont TaxID=113269 RepID=UPI001C8EC48A|nr:hypothetical protein [Bathymodiolus japonicus methanotrophic gill symbiont]
MITEQEILVEKIIKLTDFSETERYEQLPEFKQRLIIKQLRLMEAYSKVLSARISLDESEDIDVTFGDE